MSELIHVFAKSGLHEEKIAMFASDEIYADCLPTLERWANEGGMSIAESINKKGLVFLVFASCVPGEHINKVMYGVGELKSFLEDELLVDGDQGVQDDYHRRFDDAMVKSLAHEESYWFEFENSAWVTITATSLF
ncbi:MAG: hypothetical protein IBX55_01995 [Methyloprofundus sp.]|nr:hypothetical protein [Methyloprofundus sp.]